MDKLLHTWKCSFLMTGSSVPKCLWLETIRMQWVHFESLSQMLLRVFTIAMGINQCAISLMHKSKGFLCS